MHKTEARIPIHADADIVTARQEGRALANQLGFSRSEQALIATAISEAARNILQYARSGEIVIDHIKDGNKEGIRIVASDKGPGIPDVALAMEDGYSSSGGLGLGLPGIKRLMSEMDLRSGPGQGTVLTMKKWKPWNRRDGKQVDDD
jgi:serine/threonine-protein kinase RsbT